jgi:hypothetical protein
VCPFNASLKSGFIPSEWKSENLTPIHKKDLKEPADNYRQSRYCLSLARSWNAAFTQDFMIMLLTSSVHPNTAFSEIDPASPNSCLSSRSSDKI